MKSSERFSQRGRNPIMGGISAKLKEQFDHPDFVKRLKAGSESAYRELVDSFLPWAKSFVKKKYGLSDEDARDVTQDFFQRLVEKIEQYDEAEGRFLAWAFQILRNLAVDWLRRYKKIAWTSLDEVPADGLALSFEDDPTTTLKDDLSPLEKLPMEVRAAFLKLNDRYQQFLGLMLSGKSDEAIGQVLQLPNEGALWTLRSRALSKLKEEFGKIKSTQGGQ
jgi:RNA polymerase sigma factor (sigma-70 family)